MLVINLWGAPGSGKSTIAAGLFYLLKIARCRVELVGEFAKDLVWERSADYLENDQLAIFAEQNHRLVRLIPHGVEIAITDSPLPLSSLFMKNPPSQHVDSLIFDVFDNYENLNFLIRREHAFEDFGRIHDEDQAREIDRDLEAFMRQKHVVFDEIVASPSSHQHIYQMLKGLDHPALAPLRSSPLQ